MEEWISVRDKLPAEGELVRTMIQNSKGIHNEAFLRRKGNLWFLSDGTMYVYYTPTHWKPI